MTKATKVDDLKGKVAVITGAGSGFGREFARTAARDGMALVLADVQADALAATVAELDGASSTRCVRPDRLEIEWT